MCHTKLKSPFLAWLKLNAPVLGKVHVTFISEYPSPAPWVGLVQDIWNDVRPSDDQIPLLTLIIMLIVESMS